MARELWTEPLDRAFESIYRREAVETWRIAGVWVGFAYWTLCIGRMLRRDIDTQAAKAGHVM